jgi:hypothetical protein
MSLIAWYPLKGDTLDYSGNGTTLVNSGTNTLIDNGKIGKTYTKTDGCYLTEFTKIPDTVSISLWFKHNGTDWLSECLFGTRTGDNGFMLYRNDGDADGYYRIYFWYNSTSGAVVGYNPWPGISGFAADTWYHITMVRQDNGKLFFYRDGVLISENNPPGDFASWHNNDRKLAFHSQGDGSGYTAGNYNFNDIRIYDHALSIKEIKEIAKAKILHYTFDDLQEPTVNMGVDVVDLKQTAYATGWGHCGYGGSDITWRAHTGPGPNGENGPLGRITKTAGTGDYRTHRSNIGVIANRTFTATVWVKNNGGVTSGASLNIGGTDTEITGRAFELTNAWQKVTITKTFTSARTETEIRVYIMGIPVGADFLVCNAQIEEKDHDTPFVIGSREGVINDSSGLKNNATLALATTPQWISDSKIGGGAYYFKGTGDHIRIGNMGSLAGLTNCTISFWRKNAATITHWLPFVGQSGSYYIMATSGGTGAFYHANIGSSTLTIYKDGVNMGASATPFTDTTTWHHYVIKNVNLSAWTDFKISGYGDVWNCEGSFDDIRIYNTLLSDEDVLELYQTRASLDDNGNLYGGQILQSVYVPSLIDYSTWVVGTNGSQPGFSQNGEAAANSIRSYSNPWGEEDIVWYSPGNDVTSDADGGWATSAFNIDPTKKYRFAVWIRREDVGNGRTYFGTNGYDAAGANVGVLSLAGVVNTNAYFTSGLITDWPRLANEWLLFVAHVHPHTYTLTTNDPQTGIYDKFGNKLYSMSDFKWRNTNTKTIHRTYLYYSTSEKEKQMWYRPRVDMCDGREASLQDLLTCGENPNLYTYGILTAQGVDSRGNINGHNFSEVGIVNGMIAYYPLDENANDYSGNGKNGTVSGAISAPGIKKKGYRFDGVNDYINFGTGETFFPLQRFSVSMWFKSQGVTATTGITPGLFGFTFGIRGLVEANGDVSFGIFTTTSSASIASSGYNYHDNLWHHVVATCDGSNIYLYLDGVLKAQTTASWWTGSTSWPTNQWNIGRDNNDSTYFFRGSLDEVRIYNRALSLEEVGILYGMIAPREPAMKMTRDTVYIRGEFKEVMI